MQRQAEVATGASLSFASGGRSAQGYAWGRPNLIERRAEAFRPPLFKPNTSRRNRLENTLRRYFDLQVGTIWRDLKAELADVRGRLLDIGCGAQVFRDLVPPGATYHGIDTREAEVKFGYRLPDVDYFDGDAWGVRDGSIDTALCTEVLEHVADPAAFLANVHRCLRPGGRLVLTVPFAARWHFIPHDYWRFTPSSLRMLLEAAGFAAIRVQARGTPLTVACYKVMALHLMTLFGSPDRRPGAAMRAIGLLTSPLLIALAVLANVSLRASWGDDCLGYTVTAVRRV